MYVCGDAYHFPREEGERDRERVSRVSLRAAKCNVAKSGQERERGSWSLRMSISADKGKREGGWVRGVYCEAV